MADSTERVPAGLIVPLCVQSPCTWPVPQQITVGVPLPKGSLNPLDPVTLLDSAGLPAPVQTFPLARWSDGSVQWLLVDFVLPSVRKGTTHWQVVHSAPESASDLGRKTLRVTESPDAFAVDTGVATFHLRQSAPWPVAKVFLDGQEVFDPSTARLTLTDPQGRPGTPRVDRAALEAGGPVRATVRWEGTFAGRVPCRFVARLCCFAGTGLARFRLTLHNPNRARHPGGLWDLGDPGSVFFRDLSVELGLPGTGTCETTWIAEEGQPPRGEKARDLEIYQDSSGGDNWRSTNHVNRHGQVPCSFRGYRLQAEGRTEFGLRASPVVAVQGPAGCVTAAIPEFWQQFPKAMEVENRVLRLRLFPRQFGDLFELQGGEQKTHTVWFHFGPGGPAPLACLAWAHQPTRVQATPEWYVASEAVPYLEPASAEDRFGELFSQAVRGPNRLVARREIIDEYSWRNFGEVYADHEAAYYAGPKPVISHYNNQYDLVYGALLQFFRTGDPAWFELADPLARHVIDIDIYHTDRDKAAYNGGLFWFTDHYKDAATCTHRTYSRANGRPNDRSYGGGPSSNHNFTTGLLHYFFLTGDPPAREAVLGLADWVIHMDDGARNILGILDPGPTGFASATGQLDYHGPGRGSGNSINALLDAWVLTRQRTYLDKAEALIRRSVHPADDIDALDLLNVEKRWSYTVFFSSLARYLDEKAEAGELDFVYAYARASLLRYAEWMLEHEIPYFDQVEKLEYPTEAWATQELRKANVLRLAAAHTPEPLRSRFLQRGRELADRGWSDLFRLETRTTARALAVVMAEGPKDSFFRQAAIRPAPVPLRDYDFGQPECFTPQKRRVRTQLKSFGGLARALVRLSNRNFSKTLGRGAADQGRLGYSVPHEA